MGVGVTPSIDGTGRYRVVADFYGCQQESHLAESLPCLRWHHGGLVEFYGLRKLRRSCDGVISKEMGVLTVVCETI